MGRFLLLKKHASGLTSWDTRILNEFNTGSRGQTFSRKHITPDSLRPRNVCPRANDPCGSRGPGIHNRIRKVQRRGIGSIGGRAPPGRWGGGGPIGPIRVVRHDPMWTGPWWTLCVHNSEGDFARWQSPTPPQPGGGGQGFYADRFGGLESMKGADIRVLVSNIHGSSFQGSKVSSFS